VIGWLINFSIKTWTNENIGGERGNNERQAKFNGQRLRVLPHLVPMAGAAFAGEVISASCVE
jgi:hypothetical protein